MTPTNSGTSMKPPKNCLICGNPCWGKNCINCRRRNRPFKLNKSNAERGGWESQSPHANRANPVIKEKLAKELSRFSEETKHALIVDGIVLDKRLADLKKEIPK